MAEGELIKTTGQIIQAAAGGTSGLAVSTTLGAAGGVLSVAGKAVIGGLVRRAMDDLFDRYAKAKKAKKIPEDFEETDHGASLLQEALNAMCQGLDEERAEAVKKVFLGLAMNPVEDSLEKVQQIEVMRITSTLTTWEVVLLNALERYSESVLDPALADDWDRARTLEEQQQVRHAVPKDTTSVSAWLRRSLCNNDEACFLCLRDAWESLYNKHILTGQFGSSGDTSRQCIYLRQGAFTDFGWKLAVHLYSATEAE